MDAQSGIGSFGAGNGGGAAIAQACVQAMESSVKSIFGKTTLAARTLEDSLESLGLNQTQRGRGIMGVLRRLRTRIRVVSRRRRQQRRDGGQQAQLLGEAALLEEAEAELGASATPVTLVGCMCHSTENLLNFRETGLARASDDFYPRDSAAQTVHIVSCAYNSVMLGEIAIPDW